MDFEPLQIQDSDPSTKGGPPGWLAFSLIAGAVVLIAGLAFIASILL